jgi:hypothetical protein
MSTTTPFPLFTDQQCDATLVITDATGAVANVNGVPVWATSDATQVLVTPAADGMSAVVAGVAPSPAGTTCRITVTANADLDPNGPPVIITGVSQDILVSLDPAKAASVMTITLSAPVPQPVGP